MNIFRHEIRQYLRSTITWIVSIGFILVTFLSVFTSIAEGSEDFLKLFEGLPPQVLDAFSIDLINLLSLNGYYGYIMTYVILALSIMGMNLGLNLFAREYTDKTADFLLTKPVTRVKVVFAKLMAGLALLLLTNAVVTGIAYFIATLVQSEPIDFRVFLLISSTALLTQLIFYSLGILVAVASNRIRSVVTISVSTVMAFFIAGMVSNVIQEEKLRPFIPFLYFENALIIRNRSLEAFYLTLSLAIVVAFIALSFLIFKRKDIHAV